MLDLAACATRRRRFQERLDRLNLGAALIAHPAEIYYYTGQLVPQTHPALLYLGRHGEAWLAGPGDDEDRPATGDAVEGVFYRAHTLFTQNPDLTRLLNAAVGRRLAGVAGVQRIGWQADWLPHLLARTVAETLHPDAWVAIDDDLADAERSKDPDEIAIVRKVIACTMAAYAADREAIVPGVT